MTYPEIPVLEPYASGSLPNLMDGGAYAVQLDRIESYLHELGAYIDANLSAGSGYVLPEASPTVLGGVRTATDEDFETYMDL